MRIIPEQFIKDYYESLAEDERKAAFLEMVDSLWEAEQLTHDSSEPERGIYWSSCGIRLGKSE